MKKQQERVHKELQSLYQEAPIGLCSLDTNLRYIKINDWLATLNGLPIEKHLGRTLREVLPDVAAGVEHQLRKVIETGEPIIDGRVQAETPAHPGVVRNFQHHYYPIRSEDGRIVGVNCVVADIAERSQAEAFLTAQKSVLEMIASDVPLASILDQLCRLIEEQSSGMYCSILILEGMHLRHGAAPSLPEAYNRAVDGLVIGPSAGSCGTAAYRNEPVIVSDIARDPLWVNYRDLGLAHNLRACWSTPIWSSTGSTLGTFAMYYREPRSPGSADFKLIEVSTDLAGFAIERKRAQEALRRAHDVLEARVAERTVSLAATNAQLEAEITERKRAEEALQERERQLRQLLKEREQMSRDLHDGIIQSIYAIGLGLDECQRLIHHDATASAERVGAAIANLNLVIRDIRFYLTGPQPMKMNDQEFKSALTSLVEQIGNSQMPRFSLDIDEAAAGQVTPEDAPHLLYIAREAVSNCLRHSRARRVVVSLQTHDGSVRLQVEDDGVGFEVQAADRRGHGLRNIEARAVTMRAQLQIESERGRGTRVVLHVPRESTHRISYERIGL